MFLGHYGVAFALKRAEPRLNLFFLFMAAQFVDLVWTLLNLWGVEHTRIVPGFTPATPLVFVYYPFSHSLLATVFWAALIYAFAAFTPLAGSLSHKRVAIVLALAVVSHWFLDFIVHEPDLTLLGVEPKVGLRLWDYPVVSFSLEVLLFVGGLAIYLWSTRGTNFRGRYGMLFFAAVLLFIFFQSSFTGRVPDSVNVVVFFSFFSYIVLALIAGWIDLRRVPAKPRPALPPAVPASPVP